MQLTTKSFTTSPSKNYFPINLSKLTLPGPVNNRTTKQVRNKPALSPLPKNSPLCAKNKATDMAMMSGIAANRVNSPRIIKAAQKNSANTTMDKEVVDPIWKGSANRGAF
jgi:hypothetical protein